MFAPRPEKAAAELARVCRSGGLIAMANWTPAGFAGKLFALGGRYVPPPEGVPAPAQWGDEDLVRKRLGPYCSRIETSPRMLALDYSFPPREVVQLFREYFGPMRVAFSRLDEAGQTAYAADLERLWSDHNRSGGHGTLVDAEYLEVRATRA
jgi:hypothetical protein